MDPNPVIFIRQRFRSFESICHQVVKYVEQEKFLISMTSNKKLRQVCKNKNVEYNSDLIYDEIYYKCPRAGQHMTSGSNVRPRE